MSAILPLLAERRSRVSFDPHATLSDETIAALLEAARWAPSSSNLQPWRFRLARRGTPEHAAILDTLAAANQTWARHAAALILVACEAQRLNAEAQRVPNNSARYDTGAAVMSLSAEAIARGLNLRQMGGFSADAARAILPAGLYLDPLCVVAVGPANDGAHLPDDVRARDARPRVRKSIAELLV